MDAYFVLTMNWKVRYRDTHDRNTFFKVSASQERETGINDIHVEMEPKEDSQVYLG